MTTPIFARPYGFDAKRDGNGRPIQQGVGAPGRESINHFNSIRRYEGQAAYDRAVRDMYRRDAKRAAAIGLPEPTRASQEEVLTARSIYEASCKSAGPVCVAAESSAAAVAQEAINAASANAGASLAFGVSLANDAKIRAANVALQVAQQAAQVAKAATESVARDTLRSTGDTAPA